MAFPYSYYAPPGFPAAGWYTQPPPQNMNHKPAPAPAQNAMVQCPKIVDWLKYCDEHPDQCE